jgi:hypothetical protein
MSDAPQPDDRPRIDDGAAIVEDERTPMDYGSEVAVVDAPAPDEAQLTAPYDATVDAPPQQPQPLGLIEAVPPAALATPGILASPAGNIALGDDHGHDQAAMVPMVHHRVGGHSRMRVHVMQAAEHVRVRGGDANDINTPRVTIPADAIELVCMALEEDDAATALELLAPYRLAVA